jgi:hypothetical protein
MIHPMSSLLRLLLCLSLALLASTACRKTSTTRSSTVATPDTLIPGTFITSPGDYHGREGRYTRTIKLSLTGNQVSWTLTTEVTGTREATESSTSVSGMALSSPADPWFVYVESPGRLWLWDGHANLYVALIKGSGHNDYHQLVSDGRLDPTENLPVPKPVFDRLPEALRRIVPAPKTPVVKPSL